MTTRDSHSSSASPSLILQQFSLAYLLNRLEDFHTPECPCWLNEPKPCGCGLGDILAEIANRFSALLTPLIE